jgi:hypothetical protein
LYCILNNKKGQLSIEFIVILAIFLLFFQSVILPAINFSENVITDVHNISQTKKNVDFLSANIESFSANVGYGERAIFFYVPSAATLVSCSNSPAKINYQIKISDQNPAPAVSDCNATTHTCLFSNELEIGNKSITCQEIGPGYVGGIIIEKSSSGDLDVYVQ